MYDISWIEEEDSELAARFTKYLKRCLQNTRWKYLNGIHKKINNECLLDDVEEYQLIATDQMEMKVETAMMWQAIKNYIQYLSPRESEVLICMYIDRMSAVETARKLNMSIATVYWHRRNALEKIRKQMGEVQ